MINFSEDDKKRYWIVIVRGMLNICNNYYKPHNRDLEIEVNGKKILLDHKYIISYEFYEFISFLTKDECLKETVILTIREIVTNIKNSLLNIKDMSSTYLLGELLLIIVGVKMSFITEYLIIIIKNFEGSIKENNFTFVNVHEIAMHLKLIMDLVEDSMIKQNNVLLDKDSEFREKLEDLSKLIDKCPILISIQFENIKTKLVNYDRVHNVDTSSSVNYLGFDDQTPFNLKLIPNESINCEEAVDLTML
ncbi:putative integral membrane protein [Theileria parva strain Muguga]|uniref:putative integral membrane protein n=1 Tax=Theileria parva strain Muguga TaxID=333668 RepID=UPI001C61CECD|nr:putative integral membrane protein [Theileria parva strain Muguga]EAN32929.2 putative integral membrane protein [Theileria parva strain Muguga]